MGGLAIVLDWIILYWFFIAWPGEQNMALDLNRLQADIAEQNQQTPFSGVIFIREDKVTLLEQGYNLANKAEEIPNRSDTRFGIASGAKIFTAVAICQLVEKGLLSFDTRLSDCLNIPFPYFDRAITIHQLLTHSSGIPDYFDEEEMNDFEALWQQRPMYRMCTPQDFLPLFQNRPMKLPPGSRWSYNNAGYIVLGLVVEELSGRSFTEYVEGQIFARAGMTDSGYFAMDRLPARTAYGYISVGQDQWRTNIYAVPVIGGPDGGVFITVQDMARFWDNLLNNQLLSQTTTQKMLFPQLAAETQGLDIFYGYGVYIIRQQNEVISYFVCGQDPGTKFYSSVYPDKKIDFTIIANTNKATWPFELVSRAVKSA